MFSFNYKGKIAQLKEEGLGYGVSARRLALKARKLDERLVEEILRDPMVFGIERSANIVNKQVVLDAN